MRSTQRMQQKKVPAVSTVCTHGTWCLLACGLDPTGLSNLPLTRFTTDGTPNIVVNMRFCYATDRALLTRVRNTVGPTIKRGLRRKTTILPAVVLSRAVGHAYNTTHKSTFKRQQQLLMNSAECRMALEPWR